MPSTTDVDGNHRGNIMQHKVRRAWQHSSQSNMDSASRLQSLGVKAGASFDLRNGFAFIIKHNIATETRLLSTSGTSVIKELRGCQ